METDERINIDVCQFEMAFPDPLYHCIGFFADIENEQRNYQRNTQDTSNINILDSCNSPDSKLGTSH